MFCTLLFGIVGKVRHFGQHDWMVDRSTKFSKTHLRYIQMTILCSLPEQREKVQFVSEYKY